MKLEQALKLSEKATNNKVVIFKGKLYHYSKEEGDKKPYLRYNPGHWSEEVLNPRFYTESTFEPVKVL